MKLYTEEQVMKILFTTKQWGNLSNDYLIATVTPIELPSDEEIDKQGFQVPYDGTNEFYDKSFIKGAKWMKEQILNQKK